MNLRPALFARQVTVAACVAGGLALTVSACGAPTGKDDPETNRETAQLILDSFVTTYNEDGLATAVDQNVCPDDRSAFDGARTLDGSADASGTMQTTTPASVRGAVASASVSVGSPGTSARHYAVALSKVSGVGWCVSSLTPAASRGADDAGS